MTATRAPLIPLHLQKGATIGVIAPASPVPAPDKLAMGIEQLEKLGYRVLQGRSLFGPTKGYLAASDEERAEDINAMFRSPDVAAIFCARGGFGSGRILHMLDYSAMRMLPKILVGYSDVTALLLSLWTKARLPTFSGPMVASDLWNPKDAVSRKSLFDCLSARRPGLRLFGNGRSFKVIINKGMAEGRLIGGNLAVLASLLGTVYEPDWRGCILALEDTGENIYRIDRMLSQLRHAGVLKKAAGVLLGAFTCIPADSPDRELGEVLSEYMLPLRAPVLAGLPFGHVSPKYTLPIGARTCMDASRVMVKTLDALVL